MTSRSTKWRLLTPSVALCGRLIKTGDKRTKAPETAARGFCVLGDRVPGPSRVCVSGVSYGYYCHHQGRLAMSSPWLRLKP